LNIRPQVRVAALTDLGPRSTKPDRRRSTMPDHDHSPGSNRRDAGTRGLRYDLDDLDGWIDSMKQSVRPNTNWLDRVGNDEGAD
jgi:hypothetical protein